MERPILFKPEMVKAILEGRKTQTRRIVKLQDLRRNPDNDPWYKQYIWSWRVDSGLWTDHTHESLIAKCPHGKAGDTLWVRETWGVGCRPHQIHGWVDGIEYFADLGEYDQLPLRVVNQDLSKWEGKGWRPSIHMFRWMSRIDLEITNVRVERVQDVTEEDATAEGCQPFSLGEGDIPTTAKWSFEILWNKINEPRGFGWDVNPWVWVIEFKIK